MVPRPRIFSASALIESGPPFAIRSAVGRAPDAWNIEVNGAATSRSGEIFFKDVSAGNSGAPVWLDVEIRRDTGTPAFDQHFWFAKAAFSPVHDDDGNLTDDGRWLYSWDAENRLIQMETTTQATAAGHPYTKLRFAYDWSGRRIARHVWQGGSQGTPVFKSSTRWLSDGWNVVAEFSAPSDNSTALTRVSTCTWGLDLGDGDGIPRQSAGGVGGLVCLQIVHPQSSIYNPSYDGNGNIVAWTKSDAAAPASRREYDAFGNTLVREGTAPSAFGFSTKIQDAETGLLYYGYRYYDPVTGRWPSRDPIGERGGVNLYGFAMNRAVTKIDRLGLNILHPSVSIDEMWDQLNSSEPRAWPCSRAKRQVRIDLKHEKILEKNCPCTKENVLNHGCPVVTKTNSVG